MSKQNYSKNRIEATEKTAFKKGVNEGFNAGVIATEMFYLTTHTQIKLNVNPLIIYSKKDHDANLNFLKFIEIYSGIKITKSYSSEMKGRHQIVIFYEKGKSKKEV